MKDYREEGFRTKEVKMAPNRLRPLEVEQKLDIGELGSGDSHFRAVWGPQGEKEVCVCDLRMRAGY